MTSVGAFQAYQPAYSGALSSFMIQDAIQAYKLTPKQIEQPMFRLQPVQATARSVSGWSSFFSWLLSIFLISANPNQNLSTTTTTTKASGLTKPPGYNYGCALGQMGKYCDQCGLSSASVNLKIVGGIAATPHSYPAQVYVEFNYQANVQLPTGSVVFIDQTYRCGGTLITRDTVLTAAHCVPSQVTYAGYTVNVQTNSFKPTLASMFTVYLGMNDISGVRAGDLKGGIKMTVNNVYKHQGFDVNTFFNDIAILKLTSEVTLNQNIQVACLPDPSLAGYPTKVNSTVYAAGWGTTSYGGQVSNVLMNVLLNYYDGSLCNAVSVDTPKNFTTQICAGAIEGGKDTCQGDSGGGIYSIETMAASNRMIVLGVVSYGDECALKNKPGLYTRVSAYLSWINQYL